MQERAPLPSSQQSRLRPLRGPQSSAITTLCTVLLENPRTAKIDGYLLFPLASFLNGCLNFNRLFDAG